MLAKTWAIRTKWMICALKIMQTKVNQFRDRDMPCQLFYGAADGYSGVLTSISKLSA